MVENKEETGYLSNLTNDQKTILADFKDKLHEIDPLIDFNNYEDPYLLRFLRARKFDLEKTIEMFTKFLKWRKEFGTDEIHKFDYSELSVIKTYYPHGYHKVDKLGRPIYIEVIGDINVNQLFKNTTEERLLKYYVKEYESLLKNKFPACSRQAGTLVEKQLSILDMKDEAMKFMFGNTKKFLKITTEIAQNYYPEILGQMIIVNSPFSFKAVWAIIKSFIDEKTRRKISIEGNKYQGKLLNIIDEENLPTFFGGKCVCGIKESGCLDANNGPWNIEVNNN